jgi:hypothetical protein
VAALAGDDLRVELKYGADIRRTIGSGTLLVQEAQLGLALPELGPIDLHVAATATRFDATIDSNLRFATFGGAAQVIWRALDGLRASLGYRVAWRRFGAPVQVGIDSDLSSQAELRVAYTLHPALDLGATVDYLDLRSSLNVEPPNTPPAGGALGRIQRTFGGLDASYLPGGTISLFASVWGGTLRSDGDATDVQVGGAAAVVFGLRPQIDVIARYDLLFDWRTATAVGAADYQRHVGIIGLVGHASAIHREMRARAAEASEAPSLEHGQVRFKVRAPRASGVIVIGSWNDWSTDAAQQLRRTRDLDLWEASIEVAPGTYRYHFVVDGRPVRPVDAARYRPDGFGGEDGILEVPP